MDATIRKQGGIHYTPARLARFLAEQTVRFIDSNHSRIRVLDPACGDGMLLDSLLNALPFSPESVSVAGFDTNEAAIKQAGDRLEEFEVRSSLIEHADFLECVLAQTNAPNYDCVIANPPYVRTQVLGEEKSRQLTRKFGLSGRVDLYQAFTAGISQVLKPGGVMGLLTSNRFMTVKAGESMRNLLRDEFELKAIFDLGDTKVFDAAVLPVVLIAIKKQRATRARCEFTRVYSTSVDSSSVQCDDLLHELAGKTTGRIVTDEGHFNIERGWLSDDDNCVWTLANKSTDRWLASIRTRQAFTFDDLAEIKVGIKTTADKVFIQEDWLAVESANRPESKLLHPLLTHHDSERWVSTSPTKKRVLYPYEMKLAKRTVVENEKFPKAFAYLERHRERLESRKYVIESGRNWFEIWVPHQPRDWALPKIVWPDISEQPRFFYDETGSVVNGDCYWIKLRDGVDSDWLCMMLAVANSTVATTFYDTVFHNKLYAGRRRFMTQYVKQFPLPEIESAVGKKIVSTVKKLIVKPTAHLESKCEELVQSAFGLPN